MINCFILKQEKCIITTIKHLNIQNFSINKIEIVREMLNQLFSYYQRFQHLFNENQKIQIYIHKTCVNNMVFEFTNNQ